MKSVIFLTCFIFIQSCNSRNSEQKEIDQFGQIYGGQEGNKIIIVDTIPIYARLKVNLISLDLIDTEVTFFNNSKRGIILYKPLLPNDSMERPFPVLDVAYRNLPDIRKESKAKYIDNMRDTGGVIIPDVIPKNLLEIRSGDSLKFKLNLSKIYDLRYKRPLKTKLFFKEYTADDIDFRCIYSGLQSGQYNSKEYPCLFNCRGSKEIIGMRYQKGFVLRLIISPCMSMLSH